MSAQDESSSISDPNKSNTDDDQPTVNNQPSDGVSPPNTNNVEDKDTTPFKDTQESENNTQNTNSDIDNKKNVQPPPENTKMNGSDKDNSIIGKKRDITSVTKDNTTTEENSSLEPDKKKIKVNEENDNTSANLEQSNNTETKDIESTEKNGNGEDIPKKKDSKAFLTQLKNRLKNKLSNVDKYIKTQNATSPTSTPIPLSTQSAGIVVVHQGDSDNNRNSRRGSFTNYQTSFYEDSKGRPKRSRKIAARMIESHVDSLRTDKLRKCYEILEKLLKHEHAWPFSEPVDDKAWGIPDYYKIIKNPMDLGTIKDKLLSKSYKDEREFRDDIDLVWRNCYTYNKPESDVFEMAKGLSKIFDKEFRKISRDRIDGDRFKRKGQYWEPHLESIPHVTSRSRKLKSNNKRTKQTQVINSRTMSVDEKRKLSENIEKLDNEKLAKVVEIIQSRAPKASTQANDSEIEVDLDKLDASTLRELEKFVRSCLKSRKRQNKSNEVIPQPTYQTIQPIYINDTNANTQLYNVNNNSQTTNQTKPTTTEEKHESSDDSSDSDSSDSDSSDSSDDSSGSDNEEDSKGKPQSLSQVIA